MMDNVKGISRRSFIKGVGGIAAAVSLLGLQEKSKAEPIPPSIVLPKETLLEMYRRMHLIRQPQGDKNLMPYLPGLNSVGMEATCVGVAMALDIGKGDVLTCSHRSHGWALGLGIDPKAYFAENAGKVTGTNKGYGGSMHNVVPEKGLLEAHGIVGMSVPHSVGAAKGLKLLGKNAVVVGTCGDGAMNSAGFNSSLNLAAIWELPVVFVIENNQWTITVPARWEQALVRAGKDLSVRASGWAIPGITVDGNDILAVHKAAKYCIENARAGKGPSMLECVTYRWNPHSGGPTVPHEVCGWPYNNPAELKYWKDRDPIKRLESVALEGVLTQAELDGVRKAVAAEWEGIAKFVEESPYPDPEEAFKYVREVFKA